MERDEQLELLEQFRQRLEEERPAQWDSLPDIPLYMDQVVSYLGRQLITSGGGEVLTSAMINNYIKDGLVPRANGKKYDREHLAYLTLVAAVKQVLSVRDMKTLRDGAGAALEPEELYRYFRKELDTALRGTAEYMRAFSAGEDNLAALALSLALRSYADALACRRIVDLLRPEEEKKKKHRGEKILD